MRDATRMRGAYPLSRVGEEKWEQIAANCKTRGCFTDASGEVDAVRRGSPSARRGRWPVADTPLGSVEPLESDTQRT